MQIGALIAKVYIGAFILYSSSLKILKEPKMACQKLEGTKFIKTGAKLEAILIV